MKYATTPSVAAASAAQETIVRVAQATQPETIFGEQLTSLTCSDLLTQLTNADTALAQTPKNQAKRAALVVAYAMYRDARYGFAGRRYLQAMGFKGAAYTSYGLGVSMVVATAKEK